MKWLVVEKLHDEELHNLYPSPDIIRVIESSSIRWAEHLAHAEKRNPYRILEGKPIVKRPLEGHKHRWEDNIKMELGETGMMVWTEFIWLRVGTSGGIL
jgi:hypothetical protein